MTQEHAQSSAKTANTAQQFSQPMPESPSNLTAKTVTPSVKLVEDQDLLAALLVQTESTSLSIKQAVYSAPVHQRRWAQDQQTTTSAHKQVPMSLLLQVQNLTLMKT